MQKVHDDVLRAGKIFGQASALYATGPYSKDAYFFQNGKSVDGWKPARGPNPNAPPRGKKALRLLENANSTSPPNGQDILKNDSNQRARILQLASRVSDAWCSAGVYRRCRVGPICRNQSQLAYLRGGSGKHPVPCLRPD